MKTEVLGIKVNCLTFKEALEKAKVFLRGDADFYYIVTPNPEIILKAQEDKVFKNILNSASLSLPDGFGLVLASKFTKNPIKRKIAGADFFEKLCWECSKNEKSVFFLGGQSGVAGKTAEKMQKKFPNIKIAGWVDGDADLANCGEIIKQSGADVLFVGLGAPKQEKWIYENANKLGKVKLAMAVGGTFDFVSGNIRRAPKFIRKAGFEWLWRLMIEPKRYKRVFNAVVIFPTVFLYSKIKKSDKVRG